MRGLPVIRIRNLLVTAVVLASSVTAAHAHVTLDDPNGGEVLEVGSVFTIKWRINIAHNLQNWDLWYSTTGSGGPWTTIAMNLPAGSGAVGSVHTYDWTPCVVDDSIWVRVRMDNAATDYYDVSNASFSTTLPKAPKMVIVGPGGAVVFEPDLLDIDVGDTVRWCWGSGGHNVVDDDGAFDSGAVAPAGTVFDVVFDQVFLAANPRLDGIYDYHCEPHEFFGMLGTIDVVLPCPDCPTDTPVNGPNGSVGAEDLAYILGNWGPFNENPSCNPECPAALICIDDLPPEQSAGNEQIGAEDLAKVLGSWGPCD